MNKILSNKINILCILFASTYNKTCIQTLFIVIQDFFFNFLIKKVTIVINKASKSVAFMSQKTWSNKWFVVGRFANMPKFRLSQACLGGL